MELVDNMDLCGFYDVVLELWSCGGMWQWWGPVHHSKMTQREVRLCSF